MNNQDDKKLETRKENIPIEKIKRESVVSLVYTDLRDRIVEGDYKEGEKLPSENNLAEMYGVSRLTIRAAVQKLKTLGLIEIRVGEGSFVKEFSFLNILGELSELVAHDFMLVYFEEFRSYFESACTELSIKNATEEELAQLSKQAQLLKECANRQDIEEFIEEDYKFHYMVAKASHNKIFELMYSIIKDIFYRCIDENIRTIQVTDINYLKDSANAHIRLVDSIASGNNGKASKLVDVIVSHFDKNVNKLNEE